jgi:hypothetical protein
MSKYISTTIAISILLIASGCSTNNSSSPATQQVRACHAGDPHSWCMQMAQTRPLGAAPYGLENTGSNNPEMQDDNTPYPRNPALPLTSPGMGPIMLGAPR